VALGTRSGRERCVEKGAPQRREQHVELEPRRDRTARELLDERVQLGVDLGVGRCGGRERAQQRPIALEDDELLVDEAGERALHARLALPLALQRSSDAPDAVLQEPVLHREHQRAFVGEATVERPDREARARSDRTHRGALQPRLPHDLPDRGHEPLPGQPAPALSGTQRFGSPPKWQQANATRRRIPEGSVTFSRGGHEGM
jgi:hypothetical protein